MFLPMPSSRYYYCSYCRSAVSSVLCLRALVMEHADSVCRAQDLHRMWRSSCSVLAPPLQLYIQTQQGLFLDQRHGKCAFAAAWSSNFGLFPCRSFLPEVKNDGVRTYCSKETCCNTNMYTRGLCVFVYVLYAGTCV